VRESPRLSANGRFYSRELAQFEHGVSLGYMRLERDARISAAFTFTDYIRDTTQFLTATVDKPARRALADRLRATANVLEAADRPPPGE
jgi:hypothetical protein